MDLGQGLGQIAIAFIGHDDAGARFRHQKVSSGYAHIRVYIFLPQYGARFAHNFRHFFQCPVFVQMVVIVAECIGYLFFF